MVEHKDVVLALLPAAAALAGLDLVYLGLVAAAVGAFDPGTSKKVLAPTRRPAIAVIVSFSLGILCVGTATWWLALLRDNHVLYIITLWVFVAQLVSLVIATIWSVARVVWG